MTPEEKRRNDAQYLADQLNKDFAGDKQNIQISRAWFEALANGAKPADGRTTELQGFQTFVAQTLINLEPFRRRLNENAKIINHISQNVIMPNLEAVKPMLKEIEDSLSRLSQFYNPPQRLVINSPMPPRISEAIQRNEIVTEIRALRNQVEKLTDVKPSDTPQELTKEGAETTSQGVANKPYAVVEGSRGFFKLHKQGEKISVGAKGSRHFRYLQSLCEPHFGVQKNAQAVFEAIRLPKDKNDSRLAEFNPQRNTRIAELLEFAKKELQKNAKLRGKIKFRSDTQKKNYWLELEG